MFNIFFLKCIKKAEVDRGARDQQMNIHHR